MNWQLESKFWTQFVLRMLHHVMHLQAINSYSLGSISAFSIISSILDLAHPTSTPTSTGIYPDTIIVSALFLPRSSSILRESDPIYLLSPPHFCFINRIYTGISPRQRHTPRVFVLHNDQSRPLRGGPCHEIHGLFPAKKGRQTNSRPG